ncbi:hypothetical protein CAL7716_043330 [Calothrix sp. PCC 7716]|nr:hypothetical protein CAL7716_043330 [Calothrix sp. PCC 7716]
MKNLIEMLALSFEMRGLAYAALSMTTLDQLFCGVLLEKFKIKIYMYYTCLNWLIVVDNLTSIGKGLIPIF